jgi:uncharacterized alkaline shock family protein YloU
MSDYSNPPGKTTVSPSVLMTIARMAALGVPGVRAVGKAGSAANRLPRHRLTGGVRLAIQEDLISGDMYLVIKAGVNVREVCRDVQQQVARALQEMAGMNVARLDIHVEDIDYEGTEA